MLLMKCKCFIFKKKKEISLHSILSDIVFKLVADYPNDMDLGKKAREFKKDVDEVQSDKDTVAFLDKWRSIT